MSDSIITLDAYRTLDRPKLGWIVPGFIPKPGLVTLVGPPYCGKSFLALQLALSVAQGTAFLGVACGPPQKVLYLQLDTSEAVWRDRLEKLVAHKVDLSGELYMIHPDHMRLPLDLTRPDDVLWLKSQIDSLSPDLVIIDVFRELHTYNENDATAQKLVMNGILRSMPQQAVFLLHHTKKQVVDPESQEDPDPVKAGRGSNYISGKADASWLLYSDALYVTSRFAERAVFQAAFDEAGLWSFRPMENRNLGAVLLSLCSQNPSHSHNFIYEHNRKLITDLGVSRWKYFDLVKKHPCVHNQPLGRGPEKDRPSEQQNSKDQPNHFHAPSLSTDTPSFPSVVYCLDCPPPSPVQ